MKRLNIHIGVGGRFHADQMANAFIQGGHNVTVFTSYPKSRFDTVPNSHLRTFVASELAYRSIRNIGLEQTGENLKMVSFGHWLSRTMPCSEGDYVFIWSSFALETFSRGGNFRRVLMRDSTHINHQLELLADEHKKFGLRFRSNQLCVHRELEEYRLADAIIVLSNFAKKTFTQRGIDPNKIWVFPLGVNTERFKPRLVSKVEVPLEVIYFGTLSLRKGVQYLLEGTRHFTNDKVRVTLIGPVESSFRDILQKYNHVSHFPAMPHEKLAPIVASKQIYIFPSLEDGFPNSLIQAMASGLVPITTAESGPAELIRDGVEGFLIPSRNSQVIQHKLEEVLERPEVLLPMRKAAIELAQANQWSGYGRLLNEWVRGGRVIPTEINPPSEANSASI